MFSKKCLLSKSFGHQKKVTNNNVPMINFSPKLSVKKSNFQQKFLVKKKIIKIC